MDYYNLDDFPSKPVSPSTPDPSPIIPQRNYRIHTFLLTFVLMFVVWILLSGRFDAFHLGMGVISSALVAYFSRDLLFVSGRLQGLSTLFARLILYFPWLLWQIILANIHVLRLAFHPRLMEQLDPHILRLRSRLKTDLSLVTYSNSITLTPGTITVYASINGEVTVHALDRHSGDEEALRTMEEKVARAFGEI